MWLGWAGSSRVSAAGLQGRWLGCRPGWHGHREVGDGRGPLAGVGVSEALEPFAWEFLEMSQPPTVCGNRSWSGGSPLAQRHGSASPSVGGVTPSQRGRCPGLPV